MRVNLYFYLVMVLVLGSLRPSLAAAISPLAVVKVRSKLCSQTADPYRGSGVVFTDRDQVFVLTSEHVLLYGPDAKYCYSVQFANTPAYPARLVRADWATGLALLEMGSSAEVIPQLGAIGLPSLEDLVAGSSVVTADRLSIIGFPWSLDQQLVDPDARVLIQDTHRLILPGVPSMIEIFGAHAEFGMSGGAVLVAKTRQFLGLLSHQRLVMQLGKASQAEPAYPGSMRVDNHLFVIPASKIKEWLNGHDSQLVQYGSDRINKVQAIRWKKIQFELNQKPVELPPGSPSKIGGGDGAGVGGGDGAGVGGAGLPQGANDFSVKLGGTLEKGSAPVPYLMGLSLPPGPLQAEIGFFAKLRDHELTLEVLRFNSLEEFFALGLRPDLVPIFTRSDHSVPSELNLVNLRAQELSNLLLENPKAQAELKMEGRLLLRQMIAVSLFLRSNATLVGPALTAGLRKHPGWEQLFLLADEASYDQVVELYGILNQLK